MRQIVEGLLQSKNILITSHINPDGDAVSSMVSIGLALSHLNKSIYLYNESPIPAVYNFLPLVDKIKTDINDMEKFDTGIILDCGDIKRVGAKVDEISKLPTIINIDHHETNTLFGNFQIIDKKASATTEIVYRLVKALGVKIVETIATSIYTGILTDTGSFRFSNTNKSAFAICAEMIDFGVNPFKISRYVYGTYPIGRIKLLNLAINSIEMSPNGKLSIMTLTQRMLKKTGTDFDDADGFINYARGIKDVKIAILIQETSHKSSLPKGLRPFNVSLRSDGTIDVAKIAAKFGGGGHRNAAGFSIESTLSELKQEIIKLSNKL